MSADLLFVRRSWFLPKPLCRLRGILGTPMAIGTAESVRETLSRLFPGLRWQAEGVPAILPAAAAGSVPWFSHGLPELQLFAEQDGCVRYVFATRIEVAEIRLLESKLRVVAIDMQADSLPGMLFGNV